MDLSLLQHNLQTNANRMVSYTMTTTPFHPPSHVVMYMRAMQHSIMGEVWEKTRPLDTFRESITALLIVAIPEEFLGS